ncbi:CHC2 zinc finger domain-containing protein [Pedobacter sp. GR22-6]|uniref:CHC2 zinc finger domain-containing protein n=1 Tax=Pedobacter sp. GR22-6 TaxID=3127957 RepID=UPI00307D8A11
MDLIAKRAREIKDTVSMIDFLSRLGFQPASKPSRETKYISPLRDSDKDASFSVNDAKGFWRDYGTGQGGNIIDFAMLYWKGLRFTEALDKITEVCNLNIDAGNVRPEGRKRIRPAILIPNYKVEEVRPYGANPAINSYLSTRGVLKAAEGRISEVYYYVKDDKGLRKDYFASGWQNELGGWEVRNKYFKGCLGKKGLTFIPRDPKQLVVFEGYMNYLSWVNDNRLSDKSVLVLNSLALLESGIKKASGFSDIDLYMDHDKAGISATVVWKKALPYSVDKSAVYTGYNDYNEKTMAELKEAKLHTSIAR